MFKVDKDREKYRERVFSNHERIENELRIRDRFSRAAIGVVPYGSSALTEVYEEFAYKHKQNIPDYKMGIVEGDSYLISQLRRENTMQSDMKIMDLVFKGLSEPRLSDGKYQQKYVANFVKQAVQILEKHQSSIDALNTGIQGTRAANSRLIENARKLSEKIGILNYNLRDVEGALEKQEIQKKNNSANIERIEKMLVNTRKVLSDTMQSVEKLHANEDEVKDIAKVLFDNTVRVSTQGFESVKNINRLEKELKILIENPSQDKKTVIAKSNELKRAIEKEQEKRLVFDRTLNTIGDAGSLLSLIAEASGNPRLAKQISVVSQAGVTIVRAAGSLLGIAGAAAASGPLAPVVAIAGAIFSIFSLFNEDSQSNPTQLIIDQIYELSKQVETVRQQMHQRFDRIESMLESGFHGIHDVLNQMHKQIHARFDHLEGMLIKVHKDSIERFMELDNKLETVITAANHIFVQVKRLEDLMVKGFQELYKQDYVQLRREALTFHDARPYPEYKLTESDLRKYYESFVGWILDGSINSLFTGDSQINPDTISLSLSLRQGSPEEHINLLANYATTYFNMVKFGKLINPVVWADGVRTLMLFICKTPEFKILPGYQDTIENIINMGKKFNEFVIAVKTNDELFESLIAQYKQALRDVMKESFERIFDIHESKDKYQTFSEFVAMEIRPKIPQLKLAKLNEAVATAFNKARITESAVKITKEKLQEIEKKVTSVIDVTQEAITKSGITQRKEIDKVLKEEAVIKSNSKDAVGFASNAEQKIEETKELLDKLKMLVDNVDVLIDRYKPIDELYEYLTKCVDNNYRKKFNGHLRDMTKLDGPLKTALDNLDRYYTLITTYLSLAFRVDYVQDYGLQTSMKDGFWSKEKILSTLERYSPTDKHELLPILIGHTLLPKLDHFESLVLEKVLQAKTRKKENVLTAGYPLTELILGELEEFKFIHFSLREMIFSRKAESGYETFSPQEPDYLLIAILTCDSETIATLLDIPNFRINQKNHENYLDLALTSKRCSDIEERDKVIIQLVKAGVYVCRKPEDILGVLEKNRDNSFEKALENFCAYHNIKIGRIKNNELHGRKTVDFYVQPKENCEPMQGVGATTISSHVVSDPKPLLLTYGRASVESRTLAKQDNNQSIVLFSDCKQNTYYDQNNSDNGHFFDAGDWDNVIHQHPETGKPIFTYRAYKDGREVGSASFYMHPLLCRSKDGERHNIIASTGIFSDLQVEARSLESVCAALPPTMFDKVVTSAVRAGEHGAVRGIANVIGYTLQARNVSAETAYYIQQAVCYGGYFLLRFNEYMAQVEEPDFRNTLDATLRATADTGTMFMTSVVADQFCRAAHRLGEYAKESGWTNTGKVLRFLGDKGRYGVYAYDASQRGILEVGASFVTGGVTQSVVEGVGKKIVKSIL